MTKVGLTLAAALAWAPTLAAPREDRVDERARQDREIVYFLNPPETHSFFLYHDYTESRPGVDKYLNVVRKGSRASQPSAVILDTGESLRVETLVGEAITKAGLDLKDDLEGPVQPDTEVVVIHFPPVQKGQSLRLRISETYTDPARYRLEGDELVFDRTLGRPRNAIVLPKDYSLTTSTIPTTISATEDGRIRLDFTNPRPDALDVLVKARRRPTEPSRPNVAPPPSAVPIRPIPSTRAARNLVELPQPEGEAVARSSGQGTPGMEPRR